MTLKLSRAPEGQVTQVRILYTLIEFGNSCILLVVFPRLALTSVRPCYNLKNKG